MDQRKDAEDMSNVETQRNFLTAEEFPEGAYGAAADKDEPVENKSTPWREGQQYYSNFTYEFRNLHQGLPRQYPGAHPTHDKEDKNEE
ncbi:hypothetical protein P9D34_21160 [Bacillus swezeyi]|uniref:Cytosolic protein n=1 Tax=Bacillus swezeyi TaxID=1925020 RepID=A0A1R1QJH8_9BACI|nr:hypothetical protein [Bacillus swezeyi]MEC1262887.1 hypothetical protein [Bacillus swezeyi]MED2928254.1 hypothetical protein [Bacillus swezeyi]MED2944747.1 hypothetical protein [Bacillus swezeyi]MED2966369.1 hypothetical protein [Bacillus swezeyi]MED2975347.1 hypothetical protein [Bacillus swezeyi]